MKEKNKFYCNENLSSVKLRSKQATEHGNVDCVILRQKQNIQVLCACNIMLATLKGLLLDMFDMLFPTNYKRLIFASSSFTPLIFIFQEINTHATHVHSRYS